MSTRRTLEELRSAFDRGFREPLAPPTEAPLLLLAIRAATGAFALEAGELAAVSRIEKVVPVNGRSPALSGLAAVGGRIVAVYSLAALLGYPARNHRSDRWIAQCAADPSIGLAFAQLEGNLVVPRSGLNPAGAGAPRYARAAIGAGSDARWVVGIAEVARSITNKEA